MCSVQQDVEMMDCEALVGVVQQHRLGQDMQQVGAQGLRQVERMDADCCH